MQDADFFAALRQAGLSGVPEQFSVTPFHQAIPHQTITEIEAFIRVFERVTTRPSWQETVTTVAPELARAKRPEVCFFSAWDFHLPSPQNWQLIEFNDNGSGLLLATLINRTFYEISGLEQDEIVEPPPRLSELTIRVIQIIEQEAIAFFSSFPQDLFVILDDAESLETGKFRQELFLLRDLFRSRGWEAEITTPTEVSWDGTHLRWRGQVIAFVVNRSTDFLWQTTSLSPVAAAYRAGAVYVVPNPFTYATRSDKRLLEFLSLPDWDEKLGIQPEEREILSAHVPETHLLSENNLEELVHRKEEFIFKPIHGFAGRGLLPSAQVGHSRLRRLLKKAEGYVAQKKVAKNRLSYTDGTENGCVWTDLRVWAYRGQRLLLSGRASRRCDKLDLTPPGGWLPTFTSVSSL